MALADTEFLAPHMPIFISSFKKKKSHMNLQFHIHIPLKSVGRNSLKLICIWIPLSITVEM